MSNENTTSGGIGLSGAVFLVFLVLKLTGNITWSWWWVTSPLWGTLALVLAVSMIAMLIYMLIGTVEKSSRKPWRRR